jgi:hypothetical protein
MRLVVDLTRCQGYAQCAFLRPMRSRCTGRRRCSMTPIPVTSSGSRCCEPQRPVRWRPSSSTGWAVETAPASPPWRRTEPQQRKAVPTRFPAHGADRRRRGLPGRAACCCRAAARGFHRFAHPSIGRSIIGSGTSSTRTSRGPCYTTAFISLPILPVHLTASGRATSQFFARRTVDRREPPCPSVAPPDPQGGQEPDPA